MKYYSIRGKTSLPVPALPFHTLRESIVLTAEMFWLITPGINFACFQIIQCFIIYYIIFLWFRPQKLVWHGADRSGVRNSEAYCDAWNSNSMGKMGLASSLLKSKLLDQEKYSCNNAFIVLCIEATSPEYRHKRSFDDLNEFNITFND